MMRLNINEYVTDESDILFHQLSKLYPEVLEWKWNGISRWHFVLIDGDPERCIYKKGYSGQEPIDLCFQEIYETIHDINFKKILLLVTYYGVVEKNELIKKLNKPCELPICFQEKTLNENACIAFGEQLEAFYRSITGASPWEAVEFRRDINKKNRTVIEKARQIKVSDDLNFYDLICTRSFHEAGPFFLSANLYGARILFQANSAF
jgi:hypothetical protein